MLNRKLWIVAIVFIILISCAGGQVVVKDRAGTVDGVQFTVQQVRSNGPKTYAVIAIANQTPGPVTVNLGSAILLYDSEGFKSAITQPGRAATDYHFGDSAFSGLITGLAFLAGRSAHMVNAGPQETIVRRLTFQTGRAGIPTGLYLPGGIVGDYDLKTRRRLAKEVSIPF